MNKYLVISLLLVSTGFTGTVNSQGYSKAESTPVAPSLNLPDLTGNSRNLKQWNNTVLVVNFWATWCPPCRKEIPEFISLQESLGHKGVQFIGVAIEAREPVEKFAQKHSINYPILIAGDDGIHHSTAFGNLIGSIPFTAIIDRQGQIRHRQAGPISREQILEHIQPLL